MVCSVDRVVDSGSEWDSHVLLLYRDEPHRQASLAAWVQRGLSRGDKIVYTHLASDTEVLTTLADRGVDVDEALSDGQFAILPVDAFYPAEGQRSLVEKALAEGYPAVRFSAQEDTALSFMREDDHRVTEHLMDDLCATLPVSARLPDTIGSCPEV